ncbi:hypothetical protein BH20BAC1_BH20BAC1_27150 [soil metagenome]
MKTMKIILLLSFITFSVVSQAQNNNDDESKGFQKERLFTGGSVNVGFSNYQTILGVTPQFGYSVTDWLDAGITFNFNYSSIRDYNIPRDKLRQTVYGPGAFVRLFPVRFLFASAQYEYNMINLKYIPAPNSGYSGDKYSLNANSFLVGGGYAGGRQKGNNTYYYFSVSWDILGDENSPYVDQNGRSNPVIRAGYNIGLFQNRSRR